MLNILLPILVGLIGGVAAGLQAPFTGIMGRRLGDLESVFFTYAGGGLLIAVITLFVRGGNLGPWRSVPWYAFLAGPLGLVIIGSLSFAVPRLGAAAASTLFMASLLIISALFDHFGLFGVPVRLVDVPRLVGMGVLMVGTWLLVR